MAAGDRDTNRDDHPKRCFSAFSEAVLIQLFCVS